MSLTQAEEKILESIVIPSANDPGRPEFPPNSPKFPATPTYQIKLPGFSNLWIKDESCNFTGTHKDRMAWEIVVSYRDFLMAKKLGRISKIPRFSLISSGSAANAIQSLFNQYHLPALKVLVDFNLKDEIRNHLHKIGCELFETDLGKKPLSTQEILFLTNNSDGIDITSDESLDPNTRFYDWLSYEVINENPEYCFIPYGSGHLFENILNIAKKERVSINVDPRFHGNITTVSGCHFIGATTNNPSSLADKLFSNHLPFTFFNKQWLEVFKNMGFCGNLSGVHVVQESFIKKALQIAAEYNIKCEPSGIAGLGLMLQMSSALDKNKKILIVNTGLSGIELGNH